MKFCIGAIGPDQVSETKCNVTTISHELTCDFNGNREENIVFVFFGEPNNISELDKGGFLTFNESTSSQRKANCVPSKRSVYECLLGFETYFPEHVYLCLSVLGRYQFHEMFVCEMKRKEKSAVFFVNLEYLAFLETDPKDTKQAKPGQKPKHKTRSVDCYIC